MRFNITNPNFTALPGLARRLAGMGALTPRPHLWPASTPAFPESTAKVRISERKNKFILVFPSVSTFEHSSKVRKRVKHGETTKRPHAMALEQVPATLVRVARPLQKWRSRAHSPAAS